MKRFMPLAAAAALLVGVVSAAPVMAQAQPTKLGVVNMAKVFNSMQETADIKKQSEADGNNLKSLAAAHQAELNNLKQQRDNGPKVDSPQYDDLTAQLEQKMVSYESELKLKQADLQRKQARQLRAIFSKIEGAAADIAKQKGLDVVITEVRPEVPANVQDLNPDQLSQLIGARNMLYVSDSVNVTSDVITALDASYKAGGTPAK